jgi:hypothetical protein
MKSVRSGNIDDVDLGVANDPPPVGGRAREAEVRGCLEGSGFGHISDGVQLDLERQVEDFRRRGEAEHMRLAHEASSDKADAQLGFSAHEWRSH